MGSVAVTESKKNGESVTMTLTINFVGLICLSYSAR